VTALDDAIAAAAEYDGDDEAPALDEGSVSDGAADGEGSDNEPSTDTSTDDFDFDAYGNKLVTIKVDGVEQQVPLSELRQGYMRQAAFTQKTQELSQERARLAAAESLANAYERNPVETVKFLANQHGISLAQAQAIAEAAGDEAEGWTDQQDDPRIAALEARIAQLDQREAEQELAAEVQRLQNLYGEDFNADEVVARAIDLKTIDLHGVFKQMAFDRMFAERQAQQTVAQRQAQEDAKRTEAKQQLQSTVSGAASAAGAGSAGSAPIRNIEDAFNAAAEELGVSDFF
jgi:hypothetical protein